MDLISYNVATININNITNQTKLDSMKDFIRLNEIDIVFLQEVENSSLEIPGFNMIFNIDNRNRGVAVGLKMHINYSEIQRSLDGRLLLIRLQNNVTLCNIYAPTGSQSRAAREDFFNCTCAHYLRNTAGPVIIGGDFNSVVNRRDATGSTPTSEMTSRMITALSLIDVWRTLHRNDTDYTFLRAGSGSRIDRFLISRSMCDWLRSARHAVTCFSDHKAVIMRLVLPRLGQSFGRGIWRMNAHILDDEDTLIELRRKWEYLTRQRRNCNSWIVWWIELAKPKIASFLRWRTSLQHKEHRDTMELLYGELARAYNLYLTDSEQLRRINCIKGLMLKKQREFSTMSRLMNETYLQGEPTSLFHLSQKSYNRSKTLIQELEVDGRMINEREQIENHVVHYFESLFSERSDVTANSQFIPQLRIPDNDRNNSMLMNPVDSDEIFVCIKNSCSRKSPGEDGLPKEFYLKAWNIINREFTLVINEFLRNPDINAKFMNGIVVLVKKKGCINSIKAYRPITLLNFDYKIVSRIIKQRMTPLVQKVLSNHQKCSNGKHNIFEATGKILDKISMLKHRRQSSILVSFDMDHAFDRVNHSFLFSTMERMNFNTGLIDFFRKTSAQSFSKILVNGKLSRPFQIRRSVRQGDPLSMMLFVLYMQPLIDKIVATGNAADSLHVYADDISIFVSNTQALQEIVTVIQNFQSVSGAMLNLIKTTAMKIGNVDTRNASSWLTFKDSIVILGIVFAETVKRSMELTWQKNIKNLKWRLWMCKSRGLNLIQKIIHINTFVSSKIWYTSSTLPLPKKYETQILKEYRNFLWIGEKQKIRLETLFLPKLRGGLNLHSPGLKAVALITNRMLENKDTLPFFRSFMNNTPVLKIPAAFPQVRTAAVEVATLSARTLQHHSSSIIYHELLDGESDPATLSTTRRWRRIFKNINDRRINTTLRSTWFHAVHGRIQHNDLLYRQHKRSSPDCDVCPGEIDTIQHKLFKCMISQTVWCYTKLLLGEINPMLRRKGIDYFLYPELHDLSLDETIRTKHIVARYIQFICNSPISVINVDNFKHEL